MVVSTIRNSVPGKEVVDIPGGVNAEPSGVLAAKLINVVAGRPMLIEGSFVVADLSTAIVVPCGIGVVVSIDSDVAVDVELTLTALLVRLVSMAGDVTAEVTKTSTAGGIRVVVVHRGVRLGFAEVVSGGSGGSIGSSPSLKQIHLQPLSESLKIDQAHKIEH